MPARVDKIEIRDVTLAYGSFVVLRDIRARIRSGAVFVIMGGSGCGKSTLLRLLAGFETLNEGRILLDGTDIAPVPPHRRPVNMMFQSYALFPHLSVEGNVAFGLKQERMPKEEIAARVADMLALVRLEGL